MDHLRIHLNEEAPELGSGHHSVLVVTRGPKWVTVLEPSSCVAATLARHDQGGKLRLLGFDSLERSAKVLELDEARMIERLLRVSRDFGRETATVRDCLLELGLAAAGLPEGLRPSPAMAATYALGDGSPVDASENALPGEGVGAFIKRLYMAHATPDRILACVKAAFPKSVADMTHVKFYAGKLRRELGAENVPAWPK